VIYTADGTTGQDNTVTGAKLAPSTITGAKIATGTITGGTSGNIALATITGANLVVGAVADANITGQISTSKLNVGTAAGTVAAGDHNHDSIYQKKYANVIVVAQSGGDYTDLIAAASFANTAASVNNPYLIKVMPGIYNVSQSVNLNPYVSLDGAGTTATIIRGSNSDGGVVISQGNNTIQH